MPNLLRVIRHPQTFMRDFKQVTLQQAVLRTVQYANLEMIHQPQITSLEINMNQYFVDPREGNLPGNQPPQQNGEATIRVEIH